MCATTEDGGMWYTSHNSLGWTPVGNVKGGAGDPGRFDAVGCATVNEDLQVSGITADGGMWHAILQSDGLWTQFGNVKGQSGDPGQFGAVSCGGLG